MSQAPVIQITRENDVAWVVLDSPPVNATSTAVRQALAKAVNEVKGARVAVLICAGKTFIAGGDMTEFDAPPVEPHLPDVVQMIEDSKVPFVAAMHGSVLGGGFEVAMACAWRIAVEGARFGLPEVNVGIIPGAGGSQRLPRLIGMDAAVDIACSGKMVNARELLALGGLDRVVQGDLRQAAADFTKELPERPQPVSQRICAPIDDAVLSAKKAALIKRAKGQQSPLENLVALAWAYLPFKEGQPKERARHLALRDTPESRALRYAFFAERQVGKPKAIAEAMPRNPKHIAIVGGGLMGAGIAVAALNAGLKVTMIERNQEAANAGQQRVTSLLDGALKRGKLTGGQYAEQLSAFAVSDSFASAATADLAIEAVFEDVAVKQEVFRNLAGVMGPDAILATNTSYLDPSLIFDGIANPLRCLGLHFFSPAHIMKLLEIVNLPQTSADVLATGFALGKAMRKTPVLSGICDGFIGNRMLSAYRRAADYILADGALPYQVDAAMRGFGMPMGPYELQDLTGLQIAWANRRRQADTRDPAERYLPFGDQLCEQGYLGQRSGRGWYTYSDGSRTPQRDATVERMIIDYSAAQGIERCQFSAKDIYSRLMAVLANEGALIVEDGIAESAEAVDIVQISGYGFPRWRGGPMQYATETGWETSAGIMQKIVDESPGSWRVAASNVSTRNEK